MDSLQTSSGRHRSVTSEHGRNARARVWAYIFDCYRGKQAALDSRPDDVTIRNTEGVTDVGW